MSNTYLQGTAASFGTSASARTLQYTSNTTTGSLLWAVVGWADNFQSVTLDSVTVSDNINGTWTQAGTYSTKSNLRISIWYFANSTGGSKPTVTVTPSGVAAGGIYLGINIHEHSTTTTNISVDHTNNNNGTSAANPNTGTVIVSQAGTLVVGAFLQSWDTYTNYTTSAPFTLRTETLNGTSTVGIGTASDESASSSETATFQFVGGSGPAGAWPAIGVSFNVGSVLTSTATGAGAATSSFIGAELFKSTATGTPTATSAFIGAELATSAFTGTAAAVSAFIGAALGKATWTTAGVATSAFNGDSFLSHSATFTTQAEAQSNVKGFAAARLKATAFTGLAYTATPTINLKK